MESHCLLYLISISLFAACSSQPVMQGSQYNAAEPYAPAPIHSAKASAIQAENINPHLALYRDGQNYFLSGNDGQSYQLHYSNSSAQTFEVVASVDGLDVLDGRQASRQKSGYVLRPYRSISIEGFRKSNTSVASFTFSSPA